MFNGLINVLSLITRKDVVTLRFYNATNQLMGLLSTFTFQLNKLKEILEQELKEAIRKLDVKEKMRKIKTALVDFFVEMKEELIETINLLKSYIGYFIPEVLKQR